MRQWTRRFLGYGLAFIVGAALARVSIADHGHFAAYLGATAIGAAVGVTELIARYRDRPTAPLETFPGLIYVGINGSVSLFVFWCLQTGQLKIDPSVMMGGTLSNVFLAGFGSMALFRTSIFTLRVKDVDVAVGPAAVLQIILGAADRECDRLRAGPRAREVKTIMHGVSFDRAKTSLLLHCLGLMQNISASEQSQMSQAISTLETSKMSAEVKSYNLGLLLMNFVGEEVLREAVQALGPVIRGPSADDPPIFTQAGSISNGDMLALISICAALDPLSREQEVNGLRQSWTTLDPALIRESDKNVVVLGRLRNFFGADTLAQALALLISGKAQEHKSPVTGPLNVSDVSSSPAPQQH